jgi:hypothetical protein
VAREHAIQHGCGPLTRTRRDFEDIPGLDLVLYELVERSQLGAAIELDLNRKLSHGITKEHHRQD